MAVKKQRPETGPRPDFWLLVGADAQDDPRSADGANAAAMLEREMGQAIDVGSDETAAARFAQEAKLGIR